MGFSGKLLFLSAGCSMNRCSHGKEIWWVWVLKVEPNFSPEGKLVENFFMIRWDRNQFLQFRGVMKFPTDG